MLEMYAVISICIDHGDKTTLCFVNNKMLVLSTLNGDLCTVIIYRAETNMAKCCVSDVGYVMFQVG